MHLDQQSLPTNIMINHSLCNERLVNRGEILISKEAIGNWDNELAVMMNRGKEGRPYVYTDEQKFLRSNVLDGNTF